MTTPRVLKAADLFCGAGGASTSLVRAAKGLGLELDLLAINHWPTAIDTHRLNHPGVQHLCESVERVNPRAVVPGGRLDLLMAGPECTHHSTARGGRPINDQSRTTAWHILKWAQELYISTILIENVPEFRSWGPIGADGRPLKRHKGKTYAAFLEALRSLGYTVEHRVLNAADYGDPTTRQRVFIIACRGRRTVRWPTPTHTPDGARTLFGPTKKWRAARDIIDWSIEGRSIFDPARKPLAAATLRRIVAGLERFGGTDLQPFLVVLRQHMTAKSIDEPAPTIAAQGQHLALCEPFLVANNTHNQPRATDQPLGAVTTGNRHYLVEPFLMHATHGRDAGRVHDLQKPVPTVTGAHRGELAVVEPFILQQQSGGAPRSVERPLPTITTDGAQSLVEPFLVPFYGERDGQRPRVHAVSEPVPTIPASPKFGVVQPFLASYYGTVNLSPVTDPVPTVTTKARFGLVMPVLNGRALDIRFRMLKPRELARAHSFQDGYRFVGTIEDQVKQIGNSWPTALGESLLTELLREYASTRREAQDDEAIA